MIIFLTILGIALLILVHEFGHFLVAKLFGMKVHEFGIGFPPRIFGKQHGETLYSVNALPLGGFVRIFGESATEVGALHDPRSFTNQPAKKRAAVMLAGVFMNFIVGWFALSLVFFVGTPTGILVDKVLPGSPAEIAGIKADDIITGFPSADAFLQTLKAAPGSTVPLKLLRDGKSVEVAPQLRNEEKPGEGLLGTVIAETGTPALPFFASIKSGLAESFAIGAQVFTGLWQILKTIFTQGKLMEGFVGPVGIFSIANKAGALGAMYLLQLIGLISINLAALNVLPFPALDGGRLLFVLIEKIKGSRLAPKGELIANAIGFSLLIALILAVTVRDVLNLF